MATTEEKDWEYEDEEAEDYEWEYESESEDEEGKAASKSRKSSLEEDEDLPDPFAKKQNGHQNGNSAEETNGKATTNGHSTEAAAEDNKENGEEEKAKDKSSRKKDRRRSKDDGDGERRKHKKHKKSRHLERLEAFSKKDSDGNELYKKKIHVRSKDPMRIARQLEKELNGTATSKSKGKAVIPPKQQIIQICKVCGKEPYVVERIVAEKRWWHKNCFRCKECNKLLTLDTYMSHEGVIYCKPHHRELFQPKVVKSDLEDARKKKKGGGSSRPMEPSVLENDPIDLGDDVVKSSTNSKYSGLEDLDVGSKFKMFEKSDDFDDEDFDIDDFDLDNLAAPKSRRPAPSHAEPPSDRYGIMEKLKRLQDGEDFDTLLAEMDEEMPSSEEEIDPEQIGMNEVQKKTHKAEKLQFTDSDALEAKREKIAEIRRKELKDLKAKLKGNRERAMMTSLGLDEEDFGRGDGGNLDHLGDILNASANKIQKTKVDVRSENASKFREMFDKGQVPEDGGAHGGLKSIHEKNQELEQMRKTKRAQKDYFKKMERGELNPDNAERKEPKLLVGKFKRAETDPATGEAIEDDPELATLSNRFSFFEKFEENEEKRKEQQKKSFRMSPQPEAYEEDDDEGRVRHKYQQPANTEADNAKKDCKARSVLNKFKEMEQRVMNGEDPEVASKSEPQDPDKPILGPLGFLGKLSGVGERRPMKRFTPPRKLGSESESEYSDSEYSDSDSYTDSYTSSYSGSDSDSDDEEDETMRALRAAQRAKALRAKFEEWENTQDAKDQERQIRLMDEDGRSLATASHLKKKFEALKLLEQQQREKEQEEAGETRRPRRFK